MTSVGPAAFRAAAPTFALLYIMNLPPVAKTLESRYLLCLVVGPGDASTATWGTFEVTMKTQGEIEAAICEGIRRFEQEFMGRGPKEIHSHLMGDLVLIRLRGVLTSAEQQLVQSLPTEKGRDLLKQVRIQLIETARPILESMVLEVTGVKVVSLHHDISTSTGEEIVVFTLAESPLVREKGKR